MSQVNVTINGRQFRMACEDGQESHLMRLAADLDGASSSCGRISARSATPGSPSWRRSRSPTSWPRRSEQAARLEQELAALQDARVAAADRAQATQTAVAAALNAAAERIETITKRLNETVSGGGVAMG